MCPEDRASAVGLEPVHSEQGGPLCPVWLGRPLWLAAHYVGLTVAAPSERTLCESCRNCSKGTQAGDIRLRRCLRSLCRRVALMRLLEIPAPGTQLSDWAVMSSWMSGGVGTGCDQGKAERAQSQRQWQSGQRRVGVEVEGLKRVLAPRFHAHCPRKCRETAHARQCTSEMCLHQGHGRAAISANRAPRQREQHWMGGLGCSPVYT